jgi:hypothetical protein
MFVYHEHVLCVTHLIDKKEEEEEEATDIKCRIRTAAPCYSEEYYVTGDHRARENEKREKKERHLDVRV